MSSPEIQVSGGAGGLEADLADLAVLGRSSLDLAEMLAGTSTTCSGMLADPDLLASAVLDPAGIVRFEAALFEALHGPRGLTALAVGFTARAAALQAPPRRTRRRTPHSPSWPTTCAGRRATSPQPPSRGWSRWGSGSSWPTRPARSSRSTR